MANGLATTLNICLNETALTVLDRDLRKYFMFAVLVQKKGWPYSFQTQVLKPFKQQLVGLVRVMLLIWMIDSTY